VLVYRELRAFSFLLLSQGDSFKDEENFPDASRQPSYETFFLQVWLNLSLFRSRNNGVPFQRAGAPSRRVTCTPPSYRTHFSYKALRIVYVNPPTKLMTRPLTDTPPSGG